MANAGAAGDMERANASGTALAGMAANIRKSNEQLKKKLNDHLKASGKGPIDFDKKVKDQVASLQQAFNQAAAQKGIAGSTSSQASLAASAANRSKDNGPKGALGAPAAAAPAAAKTDLNLGLDESAGAEAIASEKVSATGDGIDKFETAEADINKDSGVPIWTQLSNRYILNYTKIFARKEEPVAVPLAPPAGAKK